MKDSDDERIGLTTSYARRHPCRENPAVLKAREMDLATLSIHHNQHELYVEMNELHSGVSTL